MLFDAIKVGAHTFNNRVIMAPLTRCRADADHTPTDLMTKYYAQRASAGLIITECAMVLENTSAFSTEPGIYNQAQVKAWKKITDAVHAKGGKIFLQIWHAGRAAHPDYNNGVESVSSTSQAIEGAVQTPQGLTLNHATPRELRDDELPTIIEAFKKATLNAKQAGFDGVEIHAANGYLIDQFLRDGSNQRTGAYGGSIENRARFLFELLDAVCAVWNSQHIGLRLSPLNSYNNMSESDPIGLITFLAKHLNNYNLAYLHIMRSDFLGLLLDNVLTPVREHYTGTLMVNMGYDLAEAQQVITSKQADLVAFGTKFIANPDLVERFKTNAPLNKANPETFYSPGEKGYTDYPFL